jgi:hypothetical protein
MAKLADPNRAVVLHHNHPNNRTLSAADISMLAYPGVHSVWSHGHEGNVSRAALTPLARSLFSDASRNKLSTALQQIADGTIMRFVPMFNDAVERGLISWDGGAKPLWEWGHWPRAIPGENHEGESHERHTRRAATGTKAVLAAAKARGVVPGGPKLAEARELAAASNKAMANQYAANVLPVIPEMRRAGATSLHQIADALNARRITTPRGGKW